MIQCKYCSVKTHFTSRGETERRRWRRFCRHRLMFNTCIFSHINVIPRHFLPFSLEIIVFSLS